MRRLTTALLVGGVLVLTLVATPAAGAQSAADRNETVVGVEVDTWAVTGITIDGNTTEQTRQNVATNLSIPADDVLLQPANGTAEVFGANLTTATIADGFAATGFSPNAVRRGATDRTRATVVGILQARLETSGINATARTVTVDGIPHVVVTGTNRTAVGAILQNQGRVEVLARYPVTEDDRTVYRERNILSNEDFVRVGPAAASRPFTNRPTVEVFLDVESARAAAETLQRAGFTDDGVTGCPDDAAENPGEAEGYCLFTVFNGEVVSARSLGGGLAWAINFQEYEEDPSVFLIAESIDEARQLSATLRSGTFPVPLSVTPLSESVRDAALETGSESVDIGTVGEPTDTPINIRTPETPVSVETPSTPASVETPGTPATDASVSEDPADVTTADTAGADESTDGSTGTVTVTDASGPGFSTATALVALTLAVVSLLAARLR